MSEISKVPKITVCGHVDKTVNGVVVVGGVIVGLMVSLPFCRCHFGLLVLLELLVLVGVLVLFWGVFV